MTLKVALGTDDGKTLRKGHFGDSERFLLYELKDDSWQLLREIPNSSPEEKQHGDPRKAERISSLLAEADVLLAHAMGPNILRIKQKFVPVIYRGFDIEEALQVLQQHLDDVQVGLEKEDKDPIILTRPAAN